MSSNYYYTAKNFYAEFFNFIHIFLNITALSKALIFLLPTTIFLKKYKKVHSIRGIIQSFNVIN